MDAQLKKGLLEVCVLVALQSSDSYGYQIIKDVSPIVEISESTLYPILKRLEAGGMVTTYSMEHNSRLRKYYRLTQKGRRRIREFLEEWEDVMKAYRYISASQEEGALEEMVRKEERV